MKREQLLAEVEELLRTMPPRETIRQDARENLAWVGQASAVIEGWNPSKSNLLRGYLDRFFGGPHARESAQGLQQLTALLYEARHDLRMQTLGPVTVAVGHGRVFDYFDEIRKIIEVARQDLLFVDPYLDAGFVSRYLPHAAAGVATRLLAREKLSTLLPAVAAFAQQTGAKIEVRSAPNFHDRYVFVDRVSCYQSGASFKDGARSSPTTLTQITDAFAPVLKTYEDLWNTAHVER